MAFLGEESGVVVTSMDTLNLVEDQVVLQVTGFGLVDLHVQTVLVAVQELSSQFLIRIDPHPSTPCKHLAFVCESQGMVGATHSLHNIGVLLKLNLVGSLYVADFTVVNSKLTVGVGPPGEDSALSCD